MRGVAPGWALQPSEEEEGYTHTLLWGIPWVDGIWVILLGLYRDNGKENGNDYVIIGSILGL